MTAQAKPERKSWAKKTPEETILAQIAKQEERVANLREELKAEERSLQKFTQMRKIMEGA